MSKLDSLSVFLSISSSMFCGNIGQHPLVCCPIKPGPSTKPQADTPIIEPEVDCGKSLIYGPQYNGLGAFPFVARIGFKSKQFYHNADFIGSTKLHD